MNLSDKIDNTLMLKRLRIVSETRNRGRLRPATILTRRGVVIEADHARIINHPKTGTQILIMGITPGVYPRWAGRYQRIGAQRASLIGRMRDFTTLGEYIPCERCGQDETGWAEPDPETGRYNAHKEYIWNNRFKVIMTAYMTNIKDIKWRHESEAKFNEEPDRFDYRGKSYRDFAGNPVAMLFELGAPPVIFDRILASLIEGINVTINARSQHLGIDSAVKLLGLTFDQQAGEATALWKSRGQDGRSVIPRAMSFAELPAYLEEQSADHWNSP